MFDEQFRGVFSRVLAAPVRSLARLGVSPNQVTVAACVLGSAAGWLVADGRAVAGIAVWIASRLLDGVDGLLARESGRGSAFGGYLDITLDMVAYSAMVLGFATVHPEGGVLWLVILAGYLLVTTGTLALASALEVRRDQLVRTTRAIRFTSGFAEAGETSAVYVLLVAVPALAVPIAWGWVLLLAATAVQRTLLARRLLGDG